MAKDRPVPHYEICSGEVTATRFKQIPWLRIIYNSCCGIKEIAGLSTSVPRYGVENVITVLARMFADFEMKCAFMMMTEVNNHDYCQQMVEVIEKNKLGVITTLPKVLNHNSGNKITVYMWQVDHDAMTAWWEARKEAVGDGPLTRIDSPAKQKAEEAY